MIQRGELIELSHAVQNYVTSDYPFFPPGTQRFSNSIAASFIFIFGVVQTASRCSTIWLLCWCQAMGNSLCAQMSGGVTGELALEEGPKDGERLPLSMEVGDSVWVEDQVPKELE